MRKIYFKLLINPVHIPGNLLNQKTIQDKLEESGANQIPAFFSANEDKMVEPAPPVHYFNVVKNLYLTFKEFLKLKPLKFLK